MPRSFHLPPARRSSSPRLVLFCALTALAGATAQADIYQWNGSASGVWTAPANWNATGIPAGITAGPAPAGGIFTHRLNVNNGANAELLYDAALGTTLYGGAGLRGLVVGSGSGGAIRFTGGSFSTTASTLPDVVGSTSVGRLTVDGGSFTSGMVMLGLNNGSGSGTIVVNGGSVTIGTLQFNYQSAGGTGALHLNGGTFTATSLTEAATGANGNHLIHLNGGILRPGASSTAFLPAIFTRLNVRDGGARVDTAGFDVTIAQPLAHSNTAGDAALDGGLSKSGSGTLTLSGANTYTGPTSVNAGSLVLTATATLPVDATLSLLPGATLDTAALPSLVFGPSGSLVCQGSLAAPATWRASATTALGTRPATLRFVPASASGDLDHPALRLTQGDLQLSGTIHIVNDSALPLGGGVYRLVNAFGGSLSGTPTLGTVGGAGLAADTLPTLQLNGGNLDLVVTARIPTTLSLTRTGGTPVSSTYGTALTYLATIQPSDAAGSVELRRGDALGPLLATASLSGGSGTLTVPAGALDAGNYTDLVACYTGLDLHLPSVSPALAPAQAVLPKPLSLLGAVAQSKYFDGTTAATVTGALSGVVPGDVVTLIGTGTFAQAGPGNAIAVTPDCSLSGADAANYLLTQPTGLSASILAATLWTGAAGDARWGTGANWLGGAVPTGSTAVANFSGLDLTSPATVQLDAPRTANQLVFGDTNPATPAGWVLGNNGSVANSLTLAGSAPGVRVGTLGADQWVDITAVITGALGLAKTGPGTLRLSAVNTFTGGTSVNEGTLLAGTTGALGSGAITVGLGSIPALLSITGGTHALGTASMSVGRGSSPTHLGAVEQTGGTVSFANGGNAVLIGTGANGVAGQGTYSLTGGTLSGFSSTNRGVILGTHTGSVATFNLGGDGSLSLGTSALQVGRGDAAALNTSATYTQTGGTAAVGTLVVGGGAASTGTVARFTITGGTFTATSFTTLVGAASSQASLTLGGTALVTLPAFPARVGAAELTLDFTTGSLTPAATSSSYLAGLTNAFLTTNGATLNVPSGRDVTIVQALRDAPGNTGTLRKTGTGNLRLSGANTYTGATTVEAGLLVVNSTGLIAGSVTVKNGAQLLGSGSIAGAVVLETGATLNPSNGAPVVLGLGTSLTLAAGSTTQLRIDRAASPNACKVAVAGPVALGGSLRVIQAGADPVAGDTFDLFDATGFSGAFTSVALPALGYGLGWDTSRLAVDGSVSVVATPSLPATTITLTPATTYQEMFGLGGNFCQGDQRVLDNGNFYSAAFGPDGLNISFIRVATAWEHTEPNFANFDVYNIPVIQTFRAMKPKGRVMLTSWSPPPSLKSTNSAFRGTLAKTAQGAYRYADFGAWWGRALSYYRDNAALPDYVSIQNEPDFTPTPPSTQTPDQYAAYLAGSYLDSVEGSTKAGYAPALTAVRSSFAALGMGSMSMIGPDTTALGTNRIKTYLDETAPGQIQAVAHHLYQDDVATTGAGKLDTLRTQFPSTPKFMTEMNPGDDAPAGQPLWMGLSRTIHNVFTRGNHNTYMVWSILYGLIRVDNGLPWNENYHAFGQYSRFIDPGDVRIAATSSTSDVWVSAYRRTVGPGLPDRFAVVLINTGGSYRYPSLPTSSLFAADPARRTWKLVVTGDDGTTARRLSTVEDLSGGALAGDRSFVLPPYSIATVAINSATPATAAETWRILYFGTGANLGAAADEADADGDGEANLLEFATGQNPLISTRHTTTLTTSAGFLYLDYQRSVTAVNSGVVFTPEVSDSLASGSWSSLGLTSTIVATTATSQTVRVAVPLGLSGSRFLRLRIEAP